MPFIPPCDSVPDEQQSGTYLAAEPEHQWDEKHGRGQDGEDSSKSSNDGSGDELDCIERASTHHSSCHEDQEGRHRRSMQEQATLARLASKELKRTASHALGRIASRMTTKSLPEPPPPPDGGVKAWTQVACGWLVIFTTWGYVNSFGSFQTYYTQTLPQSASTISWIGSVQVWLTFSVGAFSGRLLDAGLFVPTLAVGVVFQLLGIFMMSLSTKYWQLMLTQGVLTGLGGGIFFCPSMGLIATYFSDKRAIAVGLATLGNSVGGIVYPIIVREMIPKVGFAWTARTLGFVNMAFLAVVFTFMRPRLPPRASGPVIDWKAFSEPVFAGFTAGLFFVLWATYYTFYFIASFGSEQLDMTFSGSSILVIIINGAGIPGRIIPPLIADRAGPLNVVVPAVFGVAVLSFAWLGVSSRAGFYAWTCVYGLMNAAFQCLIPTAVASITKELNMVGTRLGMVFACVSFAALTGPPIGGAIQAATTDHSFAGAQIWAAVAALIGACLLGVTRCLKVGWGLKCWC